jgi:hypothetical protein
MRFYNVDEITKQANKYRTIGVLLTALLLTSMVLNATLLAHC